MSSAFVFILTEAQLLCCKAFQVVVSGYIPYKIHVPHSYKIVFENVFIKLISKT